MSLTRFLVRRAGSRGGQRLAPTSEWELVPWAAATSCTPRPADATLLLAPPRLLPHPCRREIRNVGGGIENDLDLEDLRQLSYDWMQQKAESAGLRFKWRYTSHGRRWRWLREVEDSYSLMGNGIYAKTHTRIDCAVIRERLSMAGSKAESLYWSVKLRMENDPSYRPPALEARPGEFGKRYNRPLKTIDGADFVPALVEDSHTGKTYHTGIPFEPLEEMEYCACREVWTEKKKAGDRLKDKSVYLHPLVLQNLHDEFGRTESENFGRSESDDYGRYGSHTEPLIGNGNGVQVSPTSSIMAADEWIHQVEAAQGNVADSSPTSQCLGKNS